MGRLKMMLLPLRGYGKMIIFVFPFLRLYFFLIAGYEDGKFSHFENIVERFCEYWIKYFRGMRVDLIETLTKKKDEIKEKCKEKRHQLDEEFRLFKIMSDRDQYNC